MLSRLSAIRRLPHLSITSKRFTSSLKEGSVAQSKGFGSVPPVFVAQKKNGRKKVRLDFADNMKQEVREIEKLRAEIEKKKKELEQLQVRHDELHQSTKD
ncbi:hypothetical protein DFH06DRAFT_1340158 [Mycena polygramma]|nr:hypothetical protein DFH06DRAFT_1340158 [Mycena polygramma]